MTSLDDVYRKFGEVSEAGQIVETSLGNIVLPMGILPLLALSEQEEEDGSKTTRFVVVDQAEANRFARSVNKKTFGQLLKAAKPRTEIAPGLDSLLELALKERNRLTHHFYRQHNFRKTTDAGRAIMMADLETIHAVLIEAMKALSLLDGIDLDAMVERQEESPEHVTELDQSQIVHFRI